MKQLQMLLGTFGLLALPMQAQDTLVLPLNDGLSRVKENNFQLRENQATLQAAQADYRQSLAVFLPSVTATHTGLTTTNPLMAFGTKLNQQRVAASDFNPDLLNNPDRIDNFATRVEVLQPLINLDGMAERKGAKHRVNAIQLQNERQAEYLELEYKQAYQQLQLAYTALQVLDKAYETVAEHQKMMQQYLSQGLIQKSDFLDVEVRALEVLQQRTAARNALHTASDYLSLLMGEPTGLYIYKPTTAWLTPENLPQKDLQLSENRKDLAAFDEALAARNALIKAEKLRLLPRLNAFGSYEWHDDSVMSLQNGGYTVGAELRWNLFDGNKTAAKIQKAKAEKEQLHWQQQAYEQQQQMELKKAARLWEEALAKWNSTQLAADQARESYRIRQNRFAQGLEKPADVLQAETRLAERELLAAQAAFELRSAELYLNFLTQNN